MKFGKILLAATLISVGVNAQQELVIYPGYICYYNTKAKIPDSVMWNITPHPKVVGREIGFHSTKHHPNLDKDYSHSGYDKGHLCDASDENGSKEDEYNSFDYVNVFPQLPNLNRKTWLNLENYTRQLKCKVRVRVSWIDTIGILGIDKVFIPKYCVKELWYQNHYEKYIMPNNDTVSDHPFKYYQK